jgi:hypothetical protein
MIIYYSDKMSPQKVKNKKPKKWEFAKFENGY